MQNYPNFNQKTIIFSAPSGSGKTSIINQLIKENTYPLEFSISACSRNPRPHEIDGKNYYFLGLENFKKAIENNEFVEWEEVYENQFYGTLKSELERIWKLNKIVVFDIDVMGGIKLKNDIFKKKAISIFIQPPSKDELYNRLKLRATESEDKIKIRIDKMEKEILYSKYFDYIVLNNNLNIAVDKCRDIISNYLNKNHL